MCSFPVTMLKAQRSVIHKGALCFYKRALIFCKKAMYYCCPFAIAVLKARAISMCYMGLGGKKHSSPIATNTCTYIYTNLYIRVYMYTYVHLCHMGWDKKRAHKSHCYNIIYTYIYIYIYIYICIYINIYVYICVRVSRRIG